MQQSEERPPAPQEHPSPSSLPSPSESFSQSSSPASSTSNFAPLSNSVDNIDSLTNIPGTTPWASPVIPIFPDTVQATPPALNSSPYFSNINGTQLPHTDSDHDGLPLVPPMAEPENTADIDDFPHSTTSPIPSFGQQPLRPSPLDFTPSLAAQLAELSNSTTSLSIQGGVPTTPSTPPPAFSNTTSPASSVSPPTPVIRRTPDTPSPETPTISIYSYSSSDSSSSVLPTTSLALRDSDGPNAERRVAIPAPPSNALLNTIGLAPQAQELGFRRLDLSHTFLNSDGTPNDQLFTGAGSMPSRPAPVRKPPPQDSSAGTTTGVSTPTNPRASIPARRRARRTMGGGKVYGAPDHTAVDVTDWTEEHEQSGCRCIIQ